MTDLPEDCLDRSQRAAAQVERLRTLVGVVLPRHPFYARKFASSQINLSSETLLADIVRLPFTTKTELLASQASHHPYGDLLTYPVESYCRLHQTSGTGGQPLRWLDTAASWSWMLNCWEKMFAIIGLRRGDRLFFPFSFGPFLGFWTAFESACRLGYLCLPGGGMSTGARLRFLLDNQATVVFCTPTYALHLAETAEAEGIDLTQSGVRAIVVAGEPGGSIPATRSRIETAWGARLFDHSGMTEIGPALIECPENPSGLHLMEGDYLAEVIDPATGQEMPAGQIGELVLTNLGRHGSPLIRYRTGDVVRVDPRPCPCGRTFLRLDGGILGRTDDMIPLRGNCLYPSAIEAVVRRYPEVAEFRMEVDRSGSLPVLRVEVEAPANDVGERIDRAIRDELLFRAEVRVVAPGTLPRFEMKARRLVRR